MKDPQTHAAGFSFDADKQSKAEQNRRTKFKNQTGNKKRKRFFSAAVGWRKLWRGPRVWEQGFRGEVGGVWEPKGCAPVHAGTPAAGLRSRAWVTGGNPGLEKEQRLWGGGERVQTNQAGT